MMSEFTFRSTPQYGSTKAESIRAVVGLAQ